ncbi:MAG: phytoene/squalene synthase family protein [Ignavibacteria bacterium]
MKENTSHTDVQTIMKKSKTNFFYSSFFLNKTKQEGLRVIYAFCRMTDDIVDNESMTREEKSASIKKWKDRLNNSLNNNSNDEFFNHLRKQINTFMIPHKPFFDLIEGMEMDIKKNRYESFDELYKYCYCVASSVGLMSIEIFGYKNQDIKKYAEYLGVALQLTNIIRDIKKDAVNNRIYLPLEDMRKYDYTDQELLNYVYNEKFIKLMEFQHNRANECYLKADTFLKRADKSNMIAAIIMKNIYYKLHKKIKSVNYNIFDNDIRISKINKFVSAFMIFIKYKLLYKIGLQ